VRDAEADGPAGDAMSPGADGMPGDSMTPVDAGPVGEPDRALPFTDAAPDGDTVERDADGSPEGTGPAPDSEGGAGPNPGADDGGPPAEADGALVGVPPDRARAAAGQGAAGCAFAGGPRPALPMLLAAWGLLLWRGRRRSSRPARPT
jgi:hypothetical protein